MSLPMTGIRVLEVAEHAFVPTAGAVLSDWGADVIKVEHAQRGDAMRGLAQTGVVNLGGGAGKKLQRTGGVLPPTRAYCRLNQPHGERAVAGHGGRGGDA